MMVIDNFLTIDDWNICNNYFSGDNWCYPPFRGEDTKTLVWRIFKPAIEAHVGEILYKRLSCLDILPQAVKRVGINGSTAYNESHLHQDGPADCTTLVWFASPEWMPNWGGELEIYDNNEKIVVPYKPNTAVLFSSHLSHIPLPPIIKNKLRVSVGLHLQPADIWAYKYVPRG